MDTDSNESGKTTMSDPEKLMKVPYNTERKFVCLEYPGIVKNVDKALKTIGGAETLSKIYSQQSKKLAINFRPDDVYCKPAYCERVNTHNLLLKVKVRRRKGEQEIRQCHVEVLGSVETTYRANGVADFQFLPVDKKDGKPYQFLDQMQLTKLEDRQDFMYRDIPLYMPPYAFCRIDVPDNDYAFRGQVTHREGHEDPSMFRPPHLIGAGRKRRTIFTIFQNYEDDVPTGIPESAAQSLRSRFKLNEEREREFDRLFEVQPIWSKAALVHYFSGEKDLLKHLLPLKAHYYVNGPWRCMWARYGYDPRKDPQAKKYQVLDFRYKQNLPLDDVGLKRKRGFEVLNFRGASRKSTKEPINVTSTALADTSQDTGVEKSKEMDGTETESLEEEVPQHIYLPDRLPTCRQMFYQLQDIRVPEIQKLFEAYTAPKCDKKFGWCSSKSLYRARQIMTGNVERLLKERGMIEVLTAPSSRRRHEGKERRRYQITKADEEDSKDSESENAEQETEMHDGSQQEEEMDDGNEGEEQSEITEDQDDDDGMKDDEDENLDEDTSILDSEVLDMV